MNAMKVLALNSGSNSLKFEVVDVPQGTRLGGEKIEFGRTLLGGAYDNIGKENGVFSLSDGSAGAAQKSLPIRDYAHAAELLCEWLESGAGEAHGVASLSDVERVGHRVVHGAHCFEGPALLTPQVIREIEDLEDLAPLHNNSALAVIRSVGQRLRDGQPMVGVFDTVFHRAIPDEAALYAIPPEMAKRHRIRRYGFHGSSHRYMMLRFAQRTGRRVSETKLVTAHLEGGSSMAAIRNGRSVETSMGFTPLEGLVMGGRSGDLDPAIVHI